MCKHTIEIINVSPCIIPDSENYSRTIPRPAHLRPNDYYDKFDSKTLCYDVFFSNKKVIISGPPLNGLESFIEEANFYLDNKNYSKEINTIKFDRLQVNYINQVVTKPKILTWNYKNISFNISINNNFLEKFKDKKVLFTLSKNNKFEWISDWIFFYKKYHGIDTVLFYDNSSDHYTLEELKDFLTKQNLDVDIYLVPWNFKYGPQGGIYSGKEKTPWDSDYCQYGMFEHAKHRFLKYAAGVINADIDELIITPKKESIFKLLGQHKGLIYPGFWIQSIPLDANVSTRFFNYAYRSKKDQHTDYKWCINPSKLDDLTQWKVHSIRKVSLKRIKGLYYAHFKAINYNWKTQRTNSVVLDQSVHYVDQKLYSHLNLIFPNDIPKVKITPFKESFLKKLFLRLNKNGNPN
ncbi:glycosyltransferase family 92 protein [Acinetobacter indicus]|uniref:glycosyltransferase family 92 protein n=1 Tax=Acinetobacter indicus TaxID=756892 RepID=UPI000CEC6177|nr:glycosyltransferase family 92 protein [Acinetobacter indicus]